MPKLSDISSKPFIREYAQGAAQQYTAPVADFLAPTVNVATSVGRYKKYTEKNRFHVPQTVRALGGRATTLSFDMTDATYNCTPNALDFPIDNLEALESADMESALQEGAQATAEVAGLAHEQAVINAALAALGAGTTKTWTSGTPDPIDDIDTQIINVAKSAKYGSIMGIGVLFGVNAWRIFKNNAAVRNRFTTGGKGNNGLAIPTEAMAGQLFVGNPEIRASYMVADTAAEGLAENLQFLLDSKVIIFARMANPTRRDPSFMKTFRLNGQWMVPGSYMRDDGRVEVAKFDWSEDVQVTNSAAGVLLNIN